MKRFKSDLERLQRLRKQQEQLAGIRFAASRHQQQTINDQMLKVKQDLQTASTEMNELLSQQPTADIVHGSRSLCQLQQTQLYQLQAVYDAATRETEQLRAEWNSVRSELKAISHRVDRQRAEHRREQLLQEEHVQQETVARTAQHTGGTGHGSEL